MTQVQKELLLIVAQILFDQINQKVNPDGSDIANATALREGIYQMETEGT